MGAADTNADARGAAAAHSRGGIHGSEGERVGSERRVGEREGGATERGREEGREERESVRVVGEGRGGNGRNDRFNGHVTDVPVGTCGADRSRDGGGEGGCR